MPFVDLVDLLTDTADFLETQPPPKPVSQYEFDQLIAEAKHESNPTLILDCLHFFTDRYGWPIPAEKRALVGGAIAMLMVALSQGWIKVHHTH